MTRAKADPISSGPQNDFDFINPPPKATKTIDVTVTNAGRAPAPIMETSGLPPTSGKAAYLARLEASREWLKGYAARPVETIEEAKR